jgi:hypothetical protein
MRLVPESKVLSNVDKRLSRVREAVPRDLDAHPPQVCTHCHASEAPEGARQVRGMYAGEPRHFAEIWW